MANEPTLKGNFNKELTIKNIFKMIPDSTKKRIKKELGVTVNKNISKKFKNIFNKPEELAKLLIILCEDFQESLLIIKKEEKRFKNLKEKSETLEAALNEIKNQKKILYGLGLQIIYNFRNIFFEEDFVLRITIKYKSKEGERDAIVEINYSELINKDYLSFRFSAEEVHFLEKKLKDVLEQEKDIEEKQNKAANNYFSLWRDVLKYSGLEDDEFYYDTPQDLAVYEYYNKKKKCSSHKYLVKHQEDSKKVYRITNDNTDNISYSYCYSPETFNWRKKDVKSDSLNFFNRGFLFEWYEKYLVNSINKNKKESETKYREEFFEEGKKEDGLKLFDNLLMNNKSDNIPGYKAGDYFDEQRQIMYQVKYYNPNSLITFTGIEKGVKKMKEITENYLKGLPNTEKDMEDLIKDKTNKYLDEIFDFYTPKNSGEEFGNYLSSGVDSTLFNNSQNKHSSNEIKLEISNVEVEAT